LSVRSEVARLFEPQCRWRLVDVNTVLGGPVADVDIQAGDGRVEIARGRRVLQPSSGFFPVGFQPCLTPSSSRRWRSAFSFVVWRE
jgi:hypothetical protein